MSILLPPPPSLSSSKPFSFSSSSSYSSSPQSFLLLSANQFHQSKKPPQIVPKAAPFRVSSSFLSSFDASGLSTSVISSPAASPQLAPWRLGSNHLTVLNVTACVVAISASWLFFSAIPALLAFKKAAESVEKLLDVTAEELPDTMAAMRLSGMEISDLTMELSDLGQELTKGVRSSTRAVRVAEEQLRQLTTMAPAESLQNRMTMTDEMEGPVLAKTARNLREGIVKSRAAFGLIFSVIHFSRWALNLLSKHRKKRSSWKNAKV